MFGRSTVLRTMALVACAATLAGCTKHAAGPPPPPRIALLSGTGGFADGTFDASAAAGLKACADATKADVTQATPSSDADVEAQLQLLATQNYDLIIATDPSAATGVGIVARKFESIHFAIVDAAVPSPNVESLTFKDQDGSFLAGALAALVSKKKHVAFLGGADIPRLHAARAGFEAGAREIDPRVAVTAVFAGSFADENAGAIGARSANTVGADVVYVVAGRAGLGAIATIKNEPGVYAIGVDSDQDALAPGKVLASVLRRVDAAAARACFEAAAQKPASGTYALGLKEGGVALTPFTYSKAVVGAANIARIGRLKDAIVAGTIVPPSNAEELASFHAASVP